ncbi:peptidoglycan recognition protein [Streptomyces glaucescens]|nr:N-acetylmuramoyl-L-alanine amidase [Streptomyces glaucescens]
MKRRAWLTLGAVVLGGGGMATYASASDSSVPPAEGQEKRPVRVYHLALKGTEPGERELPRTETKQFSLVGVTWTGAARKLEGTAQVRTRSLETGAWSPWRDLEVDLSPPDEPEAGMRGASAPMWVGPSDGIEVQVVHEDGSTGALPKGLDVSMVDPGVVTEAETRMSPPQPAAFAVQPGLAPASYTSASAETGVLPQPPVTTRAEWGADESRSPDPSDYNTDVKSVFVHHTAGADYDCSESPAIVRGIYAYHTDPAPQGNGWNDLGYHFLVDKCGQIFEGRKGGIDKPVLGAHTYGFNRESTGISVLGNYVSGSASDAALESVARLAAWKLSLHGVTDPAGTVELTAGATQKNYFGTSFTAGQKYVFNRISGHRDGFNSECPGNSLYAQLPTVRSWAAGPVQDLKVTSLTGATAKGTTYYTKGAVTVRWSSSTPASLITRYEILVDGAVVATTSGAGSAKAVSLAAGDHTVAVRAVHQSGKAVETAPTTVVADTTLPTLTTPKLALRIGTVSTTAVPVTLSWKATDDKALLNTKLLSPATATFSAAATLSNRTAKPGAAATWSMRAQDYAGNYRDASAAYTPVILQETSAVKTGTWTTRSSTSYLGGTSYSSGSKGASLSWTFTGRSASWVVSRASTSGQVYVYVDGVKVSTVDLKSSSTLYRQAIWTKTWSTSAKHTVKIVVVGTTGRPTITTDGLVYIK